MSRTNTTANSSHSAAMASPLDKLLLKAEANYLSNLSLSMVYDIQDRNISLEDLLKLVKNKHKYGSHWFSAGTEVLLILVYIIIICFGVFANGIVCFVIWKKRTLRSVRNILVTNLAASDLVMCLFCIPFTILKLLEKNWPLGDVLCRLVTWTQAISVFVSILSITAISATRYQAIVYSQAVPHEWQTGMVSLIVFGIWGISTLFSLPLLIFSKVETVEYVPNISYVMCLEHWPSQAAKLTYTVAILLGQFVIPICILMLLHWRLCAFFKVRIMLNPRTTQELDQALKEASRHRRTSVLLMAIAIVFAICWFPLTLLNTLADFNYEMFMFQNFLMSFTVTHIIAMLSSCLNPILYGWFNRGFRREITKILTSHSKSKEDESSEKRNLRQASQSNAARKTPVCYKSIQTEGQSICHNSQQTDSQPPNSSNSKSATQPDVQMNIPSILTKR